MRMDRNSSRGWSPSRRVGRSKPWAVMTTATLAGSCFFIGPDARYRKTKNCRDTLHMLNGMKAAIEAMQAEQRVYHKLRYRS